MLFNSYIFILVFLPLTYIGYRILIYHKLDKKIAWLCLTSLIFYSYWEVGFLPIIIASIICNYNFGYWIKTNSKYKKIIVSIGIVFNILLLGYYKYLGFFEFILSNHNGSFSIINYALPLGISFYTFQQIAYLVDVYKGQSDRYTFLEYLLFVTFFPQLIAGPIVHHKTIMPQFKQLKTNSNLNRDLAIGICLFSVGLFKKVVFADTLSFYSNDLFQATSLEKITFLEAWSGALSYTFQIYFDFSGYSDMAIGLALMFGIILPLNFFSPYKATSFIEFWRRWHMTLSEFLKNYVYIPLGGSKKGGLRKILNLLLTMILAGLWHGAGYNFLIWGFIHGILLCMNHLIKIDEPYKQKLKPFFWLSTFTIIIFTWVIFKAENLEDAINIYKGMFGLNGFALPLDYQGAIPNLVLVLLDKVFPTVSFSDSIVGFGGARQILFFLVLLCIVKYSPNIYEILSDYKSVYDQKPVLKKSIRHSFNLNKRGVILYFSLIAAAAFCSIHRPTEFLYFQF